MTFRLVALNLAIFLFFPQQVWAAQSAGILSEFSWWGLPLLLFTVTFLLGMLAVLGGVYLIGWMLKTVWNTKEVV